MREEWRRAGRDGSPPFSRIGKPPQVGDFRAVGRLRQERPARSVALAPRRDRIRGAADLPANSGAELQQHAARSDQLPIGWIVTRLLGSGLHIEQRAARELAAQLAGLLVDLGALDRLADQLGGISR